MLARDPADGVGQVAESGRMHELGNRRYKRRRLRIALHDVTRPIIGCAGALRRCGGSYLSGGACNQSATGLEEGAAGRLLPTDRLVPRRRNGGPWLCSGRVLIAHRTPPCSGVDSSAIAAAGRANDIAAPMAARAESRTMTSRLADNSCCGPACSVLWPEPVSTASRQASNAEAAATPTLMPQQRTTLISPPASPVSDAGAAPMMALLLGEMNRPWPSPNSASASITAGKLSGAPSSTANSSASAATQTSRPDNVSSRAPRWSYSAPASGATAPSITGSTLSRRPAVKVESP